MKKITLFLAFIGMITLQSCSVNENQNVTDNDTISEVWEFNNNVNFVASTSLLNSILIFPLVISDLPQRAF